MTREEQNARVKKWREEHREEYNARMRRLRAEHREEFNSKIMKRISEDKNKYGVKKSIIRKKSRRLMEKIHTKLPDYEIHHCFGYEDPNKFIYIPRELHLKIHQLLRDKNISAEEDHWMEIRELVNECKEYTYIRT